MLCTLLDSPCEQCLSVKLENSATSSYVLVGFMLISQTKVGRAARGMQSTIVLRRRCEAAMLRPKMLKDVSSYHLRRKHMRRMSSVFCLPSNIDNFQYQLALAGSSQSNLCHQNGHLHISNARWSPTTRVHSLRSDLRVQPQLERRCCRKAPEKNWGDGQ